MTDQPHCPRCGRPIHDMGYVCAGCGADVDPPGLFLRPPSPLRTRQAELREQGKSWLEVLHETRVERHRELRPADGFHAPVVYYMRMDGLVKIGTTGRIWQRLISIRPQGVLAIEPGSFDVERRRHDQFRVHRSHGEWFWLTGPVWEHIAGLRAKAVAGWLGVDDWLQVWGSK